MGESISYSVSTVLSRERVWELFAEIENWPKFSDVYDALRWSGSPWTPGSSILGSIHYPRQLFVRYLLEICQPGSLVSYVAHGTTAGFAWHRAVRFDQVHGRTWIQVDSYIVGEPKFAIAGGGQGFLKMLTERWFEGFVRFCDKQAVAYKQAPTSSPQVRSIELVRTSKEIAS